MGTGIMDGMKGITEDIMTSYNTRVRALGDLVFDTHSTLNEFASDRKKMGREQSNNLANFVEDLSTKVKDLLESAQDMLKEFERRHKEMSRKQTKNLADFANNLAKNSLFNLNGFKKQRVEMSGEIKEMLTKEVKDIKNEVRKLASETRKIMGGYRSDIEKASRAWKEMSLAITRAREGGVMPRLHAGENVTTAGAAVKGRNKSKRRG
ncbi:MAG: hypothetical protein HYY56_02980 [Candidatus Omnitrophica bacterium]|nr:hypothetical protein [Candidatus Omnitrophota bacterium]